MDAMLRQQGPLGLSDDAVVCAIAEMTVAGINTVSTSLEWYMLLLAKHAQVRIRMVTVPHTCG